MSVPTWLLGVAVGLGFINAALLLWLLFRLGSSVAVTHEQLSLLREAREARKETRQEAHQLADIVRRFNPPQGEAWQSGRHHT